MHEHDSEYVAIPHVLLRPMPWRVREHPERHARARVWLVREIAVELAAQHLAETLVHCQRAPLIVDALDGYRRATDKVVTALGLSHRRELLAQDDGPLSIRHDAGDILALAQLQPALLPMFAMATATLHIALEWPGYVGCLRDALASVLALAPGERWLLPGLRRWLQMRWYESLFIEDEPDEDAWHRRLRHAEIEAAALSREPGPFRRLNDHAPRDGGHVLEYSVKAWWALRVQGESQLEVARRWHAMQGRHATEKSVEECSCRRAVRTGVREIDTFVAVY